MGRSALSALVAAISLSTAGGVSAASGQAEPELRITIRVDDKAGVQGVYLKFAKARAAEVFAMRGVKLDWIEGEEANHLKVAAPYTILIMAEGPASLKAMMEGLGLDVMGQGVPVVGRAYIYYNRVLNLNPDPPRDIITTLGDVMAHELGHLMLPPGHSNVGIMRPSINMTSRRLETFTEVEAAHIRERLRRQTVTETKWGPALAGLYYGLKGSPCLRSHASNRFVQSQSQHAHGSVPFSSRHLLRACASLIESKSKNSSQ